MGDDDSESDSDNSDEEENKLFVKSNNQPSQKGGILIEEISESEPVTPSESKSLIEEVSMENILPVVSDTPRDSGATERSDDLMEALGKVLGKSTASRKGKIDFSEEEKKYAGMTKEEKIQDLAANVGSTVHRKNDNMDIWQPEDELD